MYYFAYGSDLSRKTMKARAAESVPKETAMLPHYKVIFTGWSRKWRGGTATLQSSRGDRVRGGLYEITEKDLAHLDVAEGYPSEAKRLNVTVHTRDDEPIEAVTYIKAAQAEETKPSTDYLALMQEGYRDWRLF
jgi:gamma-glutamylcyclotransferase